MVPRAAVQGVVSLVLRSTLSAVKHPVARRFYYAGPKVAMPAAAVGGREAKPGGRQAMEDEYGKMDASGETFTLDTFKLETGSMLKGVQVRYNTYGEINSRRDNVLMVCHALTGNSRLDSWWSGLLGPGKCFDTDRYLVVCANILGSCYGTTGPASINPDSGKPYGTSFPGVTIRDTVRVHMRMLQEALGVQRVECVVGGSLGGMQALEWAIIGGPKFVRSAAAIACGARHTAWQIGISETQRQAIYADPDWNGGEFDMNDPPTAGLAVARQIAMFSYRTARGFESKFGRDTADDGRFQVRRYLEYQGRKFLDRFDALTYVRLTEAMDTHDVGRGRGGVEAALRAIEQPMLIVGIDSDVLYPLHEQQELARHMPRATLEVVRSKDGHDGFLLEQEQVGSAISSFLRKVASEQESRPHPGADVGPGPIR